MKDREQFEAFLDLCESVFERLKREGEWLWPDSQDRETLVESEDNPQKS